MTEKADAGDAKTNPTAKFEAKDIKVMVVPKKVEADVAKPATKAVRSFTIKQDEPKVVTGRFTAEGVKSLKADNDRIDALEKKLDKVMQALESLKKSKGD